MEATRGPTYFEETRLLAVSDSQYEQPSDGEGVENEGSKGEPVDQLVNSSYANHERRNGCLDKE